LAFSVDKAADYWSTICTWHSSKLLIRNTFGRQAIPITWDYVETNIFSDSSGNVSSGIAWAHKALVVFPTAARGFAIQGDAQTQDMSSGRVVSTDPPYYDNVGYADLSDFFYVWLRRSLRPVFPDLFATLAVPKTEELVATPARHGGMEGAELFFLGGMTQAMHRLGEQAHPAFPVTIYYAFKQSENETDAGTASTGWETFLDAVIRAGFATSGTWPMRTELGNRMRGMDSNALASSIVLVCRLRAADAPTATRREFVTALKAELPQALANLQRGNIAPVDLAQAAIGPGMAVYTRYAKVLDAEGKPIRVREALALINQTLDEALAEQEGDFDADTRWALAWFDEFAFADGDYGRAETLSKAKNTSVSGLVDAGFLASKGGKVRLLRPSELDAAWDPTTDARLTAWESVHHLVRTLESGGEDAAAQLVRLLGSKAESARELAYRLYSLCERKKRAAEALSYNALVQSWPEIVRRAAEGRQATQTQSDMFS
jgi:putative DNA methylase